MPAKSWQGVWKRDTSIQRLSGRISEPSMVSRGVESWISSLRASHVSRSHLLESDSTNRTNGISGQTSPGSFLSANQLSFSWRTSRFERLSSHGETFEDWASLCRVPSRVPPPSWVQDILGGGSSYLPTSTIHSDYSHPETKWNGVQGKSGYGLRTVLLPGRVGCHGEPGTDPDHPSLKDAFLPTPTHKAYHSNKGGAAGRVGRTRYALEHLLRFLPTPRSSPNENRGTKPCPSVEAGAHGAKLSEEIGGLVNPDWKDWFVGLPIGWTATEPLEISAFQSWLRMHSRFLREKLG